MFMDLDTEPDPYISSKDTGFGSGSKLNGLPELLPVDVELPEFLPVEVELP